MVNQRPSANYYEVLEVSPDAPQNEIHRAYQKAKQTYSQDNPALYSMFSKEEARELAQMIEEAYQTLGNQNLRKAYDDAVRSTGGDVVAPIALHHAALPDFSLAEGPASGAAALPAADLAGDFVVRTLPAARPTAQNGQGRTSLSAYKIDDRIEAEILAREDWNGAFLQKVRAYKNVSLDKLSDATRVSRGYLTAVEADDFKNLPAPVFVRGFVAQTARILGLDEGKVAGSYIRLLKAATGAK